MRELQAVWQRIMSQPRWALVATVFTVVLAGYFGYLGIRYWNDTGEVEALDAEIARLSRAVARPLPPLEEHLALVRAQDDRLSLAQARLDYGAKDELVFLISETALISPVEAMSITVTEPSVEQIEGLSYPTYGAVLILNGTFDGITQYLEFLRRRAPGMSVEGMRSTSVNETWLARIQLLFYGAPIAPVTAAGAS